MFGEYEANDDNKNGSRRQEEGRNKRSRQAAATFWKRKIVELSLGVLIYAL